MSRQCIYCLEQVSQRVQERYDGACRRCALRPPRMDQYKKCGYCGTRSGIHAAACTVNFPKCWRCGSPADLVGSEQLGKLKVRVEVFRCQRSDMHDGRRYDFRIVTELPMRGA